jgi:hypothetical protein
VTFVDFIGLLLVVGFFLASFGLVVLFERISS